MLHRAQEPASEQERERERERERASERAREREREILYQETISFFSYSQYLLI